MDKRGINKSGLALMLTAIFGMMCMILAEIGIDSSIKVVVIVSSIIFLAGEVMLTWTN